MLGHLIVRRVQRALVDIELFLKEEFMSHFAYELGKDSDLSLALWSLPGGKQIPRNWKMVEGNRQP